MTLSPQVIQHHLEYSTWASLRLIAAAAGKLTGAELDRDFGTADKSIRETLAHIYRSERSWLGRIQHGTAKTPLREPGDSELSVLIANWTEVQGGWRSWAAQLGPSDPDAIVNYTDLRGNPWSQPLWAIVLHVVNHSTHHRGQVSGFLRALGQVPPPLDFIAYVREQDAAKSQSG